MTFTGLGASLGQEGWGDLGRRLWSPPYRRALAWAAPVLMLAYGFAMANFTLAGDDWFAVFPQATLDTHFTLVAGRWFMPLVWAVTGSNTFVPFFSHAVALALLALAGMVAAAAWRLTRPWAVFAVMTLFAANPLFADALSTKPAHVAVPLAMVLATLAGWVLLRWRVARPWRALVTMGLLVVCLASYQPTALAFAVVVLGGEVIALAWGPRPYWPDAWRRWLEILVAGAAAIGLYILTVHVSWWVTGTEPLSARSTYSFTRGYPSTWRQVAGTLRNGFILTGRFWFAGTALYPLALKVASLILVSAGALSATVASGQGRRLRGGGRARSLWAGAWIWLLALGSLVVPLAVIFMRQEPPTRASVLTTAGLVVGFWTALLFEQVMSDRASRRARTTAVVLVALVLVVVLGGAYEINKGYFGLHLSNQRDLANANRMLSVMEQMPEFGLRPRVRVQLVGAVLFALPYAPFSNALPGTPASTIVNCSGLSCQDRLTNMLNLIGGGERRFVHGASSDDPEVAAAIAAMPSWPEPGSIRFLDGVFVIKGS